MEKPLVINMESAWNNRSAVKNFKKILKDEYNIDGKFHDGGDHYSFWQLRGLKNDLKKVLNDYWDGVDIEEDDKHHLRLVQR